MFSRNLLPAAGLFGLLALPAVAGGKFAAPDGCEVYATAQLKSCQVSQHYRCDGDAAGDQWSVYMDPDGPFYMSRIDAETRWMDSYALPFGEHDWLTTETDPASFTTLLTTGRDDYDFVTESNSGAQMRYTGHDVLTGETTKIDGVTFERTRFELTARDAGGAILWRRHGQQLVQRDWRIFFPDRETFETADGARIEVEDTPMTLAFPGEAGFLATEPQFNCDMMMTMMDVIGGAGG